LWLLVSKRPRNVGWRQAAGLLFGDWGTSRLYVLGLAFFAGGVFWALNAQPAPQPGLFTPLLVGWLAGVAGVGFVAAAVFMLLQRMTRAAERRDNPRI
jgi:hypothetical protein